MHTCTHAHILTLSHKRTLSHSHTLTHKHTNTLLSMQGGNRGIGYAICEGLWAEGGFHTVIACRNPKDGEASKAQIMAGRGSGSMSVMQLDLCNFESVRGFVAAYFKSGMSLDVLITNAGMTLHAPPFQRKTEQHSRNFSLVHTHNHSLTHSLTLFLPSFLHLRPSHPSRTQPASDVIAPSLM